MSFRYHDGLREEYQTTGLIVLRDLIPATLLTDLRGETDKARAIARREHGIQAQRLQPVYRYPEIDPRPFRDFLNLSELQKVVENVLSKEHRQSNIMGVLLEPTEEAWATNWHRDWAHHIRNLSVERFETVKQNLRMFNQLNGALYEDGSLWAVPYSHNRPDTSEELSVFPQNPPTNPPLTPELSPEERELVCLQYARSMPGAVQVPLGAGDVAFYRACMWHIGNYVPYRKRATLHDGFYCAEDLEWQKEMQMFQENYT